jgi:hypothetical protein
MSKVSEENVKGVMIMGPILSFKITQHIIVYSRHNEHGCN